MQEKIKPMVFGIFLSKKEAENAIENLKDVGFRNEEISVVIKEGEEIERRTVSGVTENTVSGAMAGGALGGIAGLLVGIGALAIPGIGALLIGGPIAAALGLTGAAATAASGAVTGALAGGLIGALTSLGLAEEDAREYEEGIRQGKVLVSVEATSENEDEIREIFADNGADRVRSNFKAKETNQSTHHTGTAYPHEIRDRDQNKEDLDD